MSMLEIPLASDSPHFTQEHQLFGQSYNLEFEWIEGERFWVLHIYDECEQPLALGIRLICKWPLFIRHERERAIIFLLMPKNTNTQPELHSLKTDFLLVAYESL